MTPEEIETYKAEKPWARVLVTYYNALHKPPRVLEVSKETGRDLTAQMLGWERVQGVFGPVAALDGTVTGINWAGIDEVSITPVEPSRRELCGLEGGCTLPKGHQGGLHVVPG